MCVRSYDPRSSILVLGVGLLTTLPQAHAQCEVAELLPTQPLGVLHFGKAVSISDDLLIVGADLDYSPLPKAGSAFVFRREGRHWIEEANLTASDPGVEDRFGPPGPGVPSHVRIAGYRYALFEQLRTVPVSREDHSPVRDQPP